MCAGIRIQDVDGILMKKYMILRLVNGLDWSLARIMRVQHDDRVMRFEKFLGVWPLNGDCNLKVCIGYRPHNLVSFARKNDVVRRVGQHISSCIDRDWNEIRSLASFAHLT